jgi:[acyl-carrier-protein] S-malonyltransferase
MDDSPTWRMLVAKAKGTIRVTEASVGTHLAPGAEVATLITSRDEHSVIAPHGGTIVEWLVEDGDPVAPGQPIIRLHPEAVH